VHVVEPTIEYFTLLIAPSRLLLKLRRDVPLPVLLMLARSSVRVKSDAASCRDLPPKPHPDPKTRRSVLPDGAQSREGAAEACDPAAAAAAAAAGPGRTSKLDAVRTDNAATLDGEGGAAAAAAAAASVISLLGPCTAARPLPPKLMRPLLLPPSAVSLWVLCMLSDGKRCSSD
jgi:hypothetical protein